jgi:streptogramin lyase
MKKTPLLVLVPIGIAIAFSSCKNTSTNLEQPPPTEYAQPVIQPLKLSVEKKINWDSIKTVSAKPITKKLFLKKIPSLSYDTSAFRPFSYSVEETKLDYSSLSQKDFDIDKLPSKELKFKTFILPPPKLIKAWPVILKNAGLLLYEIGEAAGFQREKEDITCLFTDRDGFLWIATQTGLDRYDGENIMVYKDQPTGKYIRRMTQDKQGRLWMCSDNELEVLDPKNGTLKIASKEQGWNFLSADLYKDDQQNIWVTAWPGDLYVIDPETQRVKLPVKALRLPKKTYISEVRQDKNQNIWIAGDKGIQILDLKNKKIRFLNGSNGLRSDKVSNLLRGRNSRMWICTDHQQLIVFDSETSKLQFINDSKINNIESLLQDIDGKIWVGEFFKGVQVIDPDRRLLKA